MAAPRITVLISGRGSNLGALIAAQRRGELGGTIAMVISNRADAAGLRLAADDGIATGVIESAAHATRAGFDAALDHAVAASAPDLVVLAGFMRILGSAFVARYAGRMLNIHPSLLPLYPGLHTHRRALADGVRIHGCTVHFVTDDLDHGPIVAQAAVAGARRRRRGGAGGASPRGRAPPVAGRRARVLRRAYCHRGTAGAR